MKLVYFDDYKLGLLRGDEVADVSQAVRDIPRVGPHDLISRLIERFEEYRGRLHQASRESSPVPLSQVRLRPPLPKPGKIFCMARNYMENGALTEVPRVGGFLKSSNAVIGDGDTVVLPDFPATIFHHEAELALVIGRAAHNVPASDAFDYIFGYVNFIDVSARGLPPVGSMGYFLGKSFHTFAPMGPYLVTAEEIPDPQNVSVNLWVNGELRQDYDTSDMAHQVPALIEWVTSVTTFQPGDVIATGTNHQGLGAIQDGDKIEMEIPTLGRLHVSVSDSAKRSWPRGIDQETADRVAGRTPG